MAGRLLGKRTIVTDPTEYNGADIVALFREEFRERMAENPAARLVTGRECAQTVLFLAGPESDFYYGQIIPFAGGWTV